MTLLQQIFEAKKIRVEAAKRQIDLAELKEKALCKRSIDEPFRLRKALSRTGPINLIAEFKRASPSKGVISEGADLAQYIRLYEKGGASAISIVTEEDHFKGSLDDLRETRRLTGLPILRKDFTFDGYQIYEAAEAGADAILLIAAMLEDDALNRVYGLAENELGLDAIVEVHTLQELERARKLGAAIIGVNNRDLHNFKVSLDVSRSLIEHRSENALMITESGLQTREEILDLHALGFNGFLIGETLMRSENAEAELRKLTTEDTEFTEIFKNHSLGSLL